jgi:hypothetical protein
MSKNFLTKCNSYVARNYGPAYPWLHRKMIPLDSKRIDKDLTKPTNLPVFLHKYTRSNYHWYGQLPSIFIPSITLKIYKISH